MVDKLVNSEANARRIQMVENCFGTSGQPLFLPGRVLVEYRNGWLIRTATKSFAVYAATQTEKQEWMAHINKCIEDLLRKSGKKPVETHAAVWVPDSEATICMHCKKTHFTMINRRHHCRNCGAVVCGPCSSKKFILPGQSNKPLRVCLDCYDNLTSMKRDGVSIDTKNICCIVCNIITHTLSEVLRLFGYF
uniref:FYVE-type domain-containing protein n=1 Tax=Anopheles coluzzii TaxID=1518534 RepID=A0A8W7NYL8_ANOCL